MSYKSQPMTPNSLLIIITMALVSITIFAQQCFSQEEAPLPQISEAELLVTEAESPLPEISEQVLAAMLHQNEGGLPQIPGLQQIPELPMIPGLPGLMPGFGGSTPDVNQCWSSVVNIPGCITEIITSLLSAQLGTLGPSCCKAFTEITDSCLGKIFPTTPFFPPMIKNMCSQKA